ncbi:hypothetical protein O9992_01720 [Vibrio lentus]|nr:hypothetical protein [Vibrio lentus]
MRDNSMPLPSVVITTKQAVAHLSAEPLRILPIDTYKKGIDFVSCEEPLHYDWDTLRRRDRRSTAQRLLAAALGQVPSTTNIYQEPPVVAYRLKRRRLAS